MRATIVICAITSVLLSHAVNAQHETEYELQHQLAETERQAMVAANLPLLDSEAEAFWDLYLEYRAAVKKMDDRRANLLRRYANSYEEMSGKDGAGIVTDALRTEKERQALKQRYLKRFARLLPGQRLFRYYQIETKLDAMQRYGWTQLIPLVPVTE